VGFVGIPDCDEYQIRRSLVIKVNRSVEDNASRKIREMKLHNPNLPDVFFAR